MPWRAAARATAGSPPAWNSLDAPVGEIMTGHATGRPNSVLAVSIRPTFESCAGRSS